MIALVRLFQRVHFLSHRPCACPAGLQWDSRRQVRTLFRLYSRVLGHVFGAYFFLRRHLFSSSSDRPCDGVVSCSAGPVPRRSDILLALADAFERGTEGILTVASGRQHRRSSRLHTAFIWQEMSGGAYQCMRAFVSRF